MAKHGYHLLLLLIILFFFTVGCYSGFTKEQTQEDIAQSDLQMINRKLKGTRFLHVDDGDNEGTNVMASDDSSDSIDTDDSGYDGDNEGTTDIPNDSNDGTSKGESGKNQDYGRLYELVLIYRGKLELVKQKCENTPCNKKDDKACDNSEVTSVPAHQCSPCDVDAQRCTYRQPAVDPTAEAQSLLDSLQIST